MAYKHAVSGNCTGGTSFVGSFPDDDGPGRGLIVLRGDVDAATVERLRVHIDGMLAVASRFLVIDASAVDSYDEGLLDLLGHTQHRLSPRRGLLEVRGLHPSLLPGPAPVSAPDAAVPSPPIVAAEDPAAALSAVLSAAHPYIAPDGDLVTAVGVPSPG